MVIILHILSIIFIFASIQNIYTQVAFESLCSTEVTVPGLTSIDGNDEFGIYFDESKFLPNDVIYCKRNSIFFFVFQKSIFQRFDF